MCFLIGCAVCFLIGRAVCPMIGDLTVCFQRLMFQGTPGVSVEWPAVLYAAPLPQYEGPSTPKPPEPPKEAATQGKASSVRPLIVTY